MANQNQNPKNTTFYLPYGQPIVDKDGKLTPTWAAIFAQQIVPALKGLGGSGTGGGATGATGPAGPAGARGLQGVPGIPGTSTTGNGVSHWRMRRGL